MQSKYYITKLRLQLKSDLQPNESQIDVRKQSNEQSTAGADHLAIYTASIHTAKGSEPGKGEKILNLADSTFAARA